MKLPEFNLFFDKSARIFLIFPSICPNLRGAVAPLFPCLVRLCTETADMDHAVLLRPAKEGKRLNIFASNPIFI